MSRTWQSSLLNTIPWLAHGTASRDFGSTRYPNDGENDADEERRAAFVRGLGLDPAQLFLSGNVHGNYVFPLLFKEGLGVVGRIVPDCDGLISSEPDLVLGTKSADCLPIFFADIATRTIAIAHAGWKGVAAGIAIETVRAFLERGSNPRDLRVAIGPSICARHYVVHAERRDEMLTRTPFISPDDFDGMHVDLRAMVVRQLVASGVDETNIDASAPCTVCENDRFFSYTASRDANEGMLSVISRV